MKAKTLVEHGKALTLAEARVMQARGYALRFIALGAGDKDFYDVYICS